MYIQIGTCLLFVYCELTSDLFFLKNSLPVESMHDFGNEYAVKPITFGSMILCWFSEMTTSSISLRIKCSCGLMWNVSETKNACSNAAARTDEHRVARRPFGPRRSHLDCSGILRPSLPSAKCPGEGASARSSCGATTVRPGSCRCPSAPFRRA